MKRLSFLGCIALFFVSCTSQKEAVAQRPRKDVDAVEGTLILHPLQVTLPTQDQTFRCLLDARKKTLYITADSATCDSIGEYLPLSMIPGRVVLLEGSFIDPFTVFTKDEFKDVSVRFQKLGVDLNGYKVARLFGVGLTTKEQMDKTVEEKKSPPPKKGREWGN